jgi:hypothetical protein
MEVKYREEQVITSPYVTQADKMAVSLRHLAEVSENGAEKAMFYTRRNDRNV